MDELNPTSVLPTSELIKVSKTEDIIKIRDTVKLSKPVNADKKS
jgi:hypothetical protein